MALEIQKRVDGKTVEIVLKGELDAKTAPSLRKVLEEALANQPSQVVFRVDGLSFMASAGLRIIIFIKQKYPDLKVYFVKPQAPIVDTLHKTGFYDGVYVTENEPTEQP